MVSQVIKGASFGKKIRSMGLTKEEKLRKYLVSFILARRIYIL
jgi:hypothetical protein